MIVKLRVVLLLLLFSAAANAESVDFEITPGQHPNPSSVQVELSGGPLVGSDDDDSAISGEATLEMRPTTEPFDFVSIDTMELVLDDGMDLSLAFGLLKAKAEPGATRVRLIEPGFATPDVNGMFNQTENLFGFEGTIDLSPEGELDLSTIVPISLAREWKPSTALVAASALAII